MARRSSLGAMRKTFVDATGTLEGAALAAAEAQAASDFHLARQSCDRLIEAVEGCLGRLRRLRRQLE